MVCSGVFCSWVVQRRSDNLFCDLNISINPSLVRKPSIWPFFRPPSNFFANLRRFFELTLFCILLSFCIYSLILFLSTSNFRSAAPIDDVFDDNWWHVLLLAVKVLDKVYDLIFPFLWEEDFACSSWQSTLLWKHTLLFNATLLSFTIRKILLEQICFWTWK